MATKTDEHIEFTKVATRLIVADAAAAIDFYRRAWGATLNQRVAAPDGTIIHAELAIGPATVAVKDADETDPVSRPGPIMSLHCDDVDAAAEAFLAAGGTVVFPVADHPYGDRAGRFLDPFGVQWMVSQVIRDLTDDEMQDVVAQMFQESQP